MGWSARALRVLRLQYTGVLLPDPNFLCFSIVSDGATQNGESYFDIDDE